jgi:hypothetical protein
VLLSLVCFNHRGNSGNHVVYIYIYMFQLLSVSSNIMTLNSWLVTYLRSMEDTLWMINLRDILL